MCLSNQIKYNNIKNYFIKKKHRNVCVIIVLGYFYFILIFTYKRRISKCYKHDDLIIFISQLRKAKLISTIN